MRFRRSWCSYNVFPLSSFTRNVQRTYRLFAHLQSPVLPIVLVLVRCAVYVLAGYRSRLEMIPKYMISATGDEFFLNQDSHYWWHLMGGYKHMM